MYLIRLSPASGFDYHDLAHVDDPDLSLGDLIIHQGSYWIVGGEVASFIELYNIGDMHITGYEVVCPGFLPIESLQQIHWMVSYYHTTYKHVLSLRMPSKIEDLLPYCVPLGKKSPKKPTLTLTICPDIRTLSQYRLRLEHQGHDVATINILSSTSTTKTKLKLRESLRKKKPTHILTTGAEVFYPRRGLKSIEIIAPSRRGYQHQSEPRFHTYRVAQQMAGEYNVSMVIL